MCLTVVSMNGNLKIIPLKLLLSSRWFKVLFVIKMLFSTSVGFSSTLRPHELSTHLPLCSMRSTVFAETMKIFFCLLHSLHEFPLSKQYCFTWNEMFSIEFQLTCFFSFYHSRLVLLLLLNCFIHTRGEVENWWEAKEETNAEKLYRNAFIGAGFRVGCWWRLMGERIWVFVFSIIAIHFTSVNWKYDTFMVFMGCFWLYI